MKLIKNMNEINCVLKKREKGDFAVVIEQPDEETADKVLKNSDVDQDVFYKLGLHPREDYIFQDGNILLGTANHELSKDELLCIANQIKAQIGILRIH